MELLDIVNENDEVIGQEERLAVYKKGLSHQVRVVNIFLFNSKKELLVPKRSMSCQLFPGRLDFSCGEHLMSGENYEEAARRGIKEELGLENQKLIELAKLTPKDGVACFMKVYRINAEKIKEFDKKGIDEIKFYSIKEIKKMVSENPGQFKPDFVNVFKWCEKNKKFD